jgi:threonylcarbamoyladenosine tRNA methylthiotransferase MtaB
LETYRYLNEMDISYLHVFKYSETWQYWSSKMLGVVPENVRWKEVKWCVDYRLKRRSFMKASWEHENSSFESENKRVTFMVLLKTTLK